MNAFQNQLMFYSLSAKAATGGCSSTRFLFKNDYIRLRGLNIGYNFTENWMEKYQLKGLRVFFQGDNIFTLQSHKGIDPEQAISGRTNYRSHQMKTFSLGINIQL